MHTNNGDNMKENINALDEINKGTTMGMEAIEQIKDKISRYVRLTTSIDRLDFFILFYDSISRSFHHDLILP